MKPSEMTNEELAKLISEGCGTSFMGHAIREAAARVRALSTLTTRTDNSEVIAELQRRLKAAEDAAVAMTRYRSIGGEFVRYCGRQILAAIRGEGGAK